MHHHTFKKKMKTLFSFRRGRIVEDGAGGIERDLVRFEQKHVVFNRNKLLKERANNLELSMVL